jgi:hypothetical protein
MASVTKAIEEACRRLELSLSQDGEVAYGVRDSYLVELARGCRDRRESMVEIIRYADPGRDQAVREAFRDSAAVASRGPQDGQRRSGRRRGPPQEPNGTVSNGPGRSSCRGA